MNKQLTKKEYVSILRENGFSTKEIQLAWINAKRRRGVA
jgi:hypothetical protein